MLVLALNKIYQAPTVTAVPDTRAPPLSVATPQTYQRKLNSVNVVKAAPEGFWWGERVRAHQTG